QIRLPRRQSRHQLLAGRDARAPRLVSAVALADHARPPSGADAAVHLQRSGAAESESRSYSVRRAADDGELRDVSDGEVRHAGRGAPQPDAAAITAGRSNQSQREWFRPWPATGDFDWSLRNNTNYGETGVLTALQYTSQFSKVILENFYVKSRNSVETGRRETVAGYLIPAGQRDMTRVAVVVNLLRMQGIEVGKAASEVKLKEGTFPAGSFVVKRDQPYARLAKILLEKQVFPDPNLRTYDDASWTIGLMGHTDVREITDKALLDVPVDAVTVLTVAGTVSGAGSTFAVAHYGSNNMITL